MKYLITKKNANMGTITVADSSVTFENCDEKFKNFVEESLRKGISQIKEIEKDDARLIVSEPLSKDDPHFELAFTDWLKRMGFQITPQK